MPQSEDFAEYGIPDLPKLRFYIINVRYSHILKGVSRMLTLRKRKTKRKTKTTKRKNKRESPASGPQARDGLRNRT